jgi:ATP-dependent helicase/nuclease subunit A
LPAKDDAPDAPRRIVWVPRKTDDVAATALARTKAIEENENEHRRLLYVAMTRAADRLIVCGAVGEKAMPPGCWYDLVQQGLQALLVEEPGDFGDALVKRYRSFEKPDETRMAAAASSTIETVPSWLLQPAPAGTEAARPITPSMFYDEHVPVFASSGEGRAKALARGNLVHRLMQSLPDLLPEWRENAARRYLTRHAKDFSADEQDVLVAKVLALLGDKRFAELFAPGSRAEVPIVGRVEGRPLSGQIDRLVVRPNAVLIGDYKTNNPAPRRLEDVPKGYVAQLALYRAVLRKLYPDRPVRAALIWTETPEIMEIPAARLDAAAAMAAMP